MQKQNVRKLYSLREIYRITFNMFRSRKSFKKASKSGLLKEDFIERLMLAVTEVNGCDICSYAHTNMALEAGLSDDEIEDLLGGAFDQAPKDQLPALMFAQHYADSRGKPSIDSWIRIVDIYGLEKASGILGAIRLIMAGNAYGIPWSSFFNRLKGEPDTRSNIFYEIGMILSTFIFVPLAYLKSLIS